MEISETVKDYTIKVLQQQLRTIFKLLGAQETRDITSKIMHDIEREKLMGK